MFIIQGHYSPGNRDIVIWWMTPSSPFRERDYCNRAGEYNMLLNMSLNTSVTFETPANSLAESELLLKFELLRFPMDNRVLQWNLR